MTRYEYGRGKTEKRAECLKPPRKAIASALFAVYCAAIAAMLLTSLFLRVRLLEIEGDNSAMAAKIEELEDENRHKRIRYEFSQDLDRLEDKARNELGMVDETELKHYDMSVQDIDKG